MRRRLCVAELQAVAHAAIAWGNRAYPDKPEASFDAQPEDEKLLILQGIEGFFHALEDLGYTVIAPRERSPNR